MPDQTTHKFTYGDHQLAYDVRGQGDHTVVLIPGMLITRRMQWPLADELTGRGLRVVTFDPLGWGESDRPREYWHHSMPNYARQVVALLDELSLERAVVFGTSAGANITLAMAAQSPERLNGIVLESPVLDRAMLPGAIGMVPLLAAFTIGTPVTGALAQIVRRVPRTGGLQDLLLDWFSHDPVARGAAMKGMILGGPKLHRDVRTAITTPALVIGQKLDPIHPYADQVDLAQELGGARFHRASSYLELRRRPARLAVEIADFIHSCPASATTGITAKANGSQRARRAASAK